MLGLIVLSSLEIIDNKTCKTESSGLVEPQQRCDGPLQNVLGGSLESYELIYSKCCLEK